MLKRNWADLSRKLVDRGDMLFTVGAMQAALGEASLDFFGEGVLPTSTYPNPFPVTLSNLSLGGSVGSGISYDPNGQITRIDPTSPLNQNNFVTPTADPALPRWDLLVIRYKMTGQTAIPKPSDPILTVYLNLIDDYQLAIVPGVPSNTPSYPVKGTLDIILGGIRVPPGATLGSACTLDLNIREIAQAFKLTKSTFKSEVPMGNVDGVNQSYALSALPMNATSILLTLDSIAIPVTDWILAGQNVVFNTPPVPGQSVYVWYVASDPMSQNPVSGQQEAPVGVVDGVNATFSLSGRPADNLTCLLFVNGKLVPNVGWTLNQNALQSTITFVPAEVPQPGQDVYAFYLVNPQTVGVSPQGGGGSGGFAVQGTPLSPLTISASGGVGVTSAQRQLKYVTSLAGQTPVTANPQVQAGTVLGQELMLIGTSAVNSVVLSHGNGLDLNGTMILDNNSSILLVWNGSSWYETSRR